MPQQEPGPEPCCCPAQGLLAMCPCPEHPCHPSAAIRPRVTLPVSTPSSSPRRGLGCLGAVWGCLRPAPCSQAAGCVWPLSLPLPGQLSKEEPKARLRHLGAGQHRPRQGAAWSGDPPPSSPGRRILGFREVPSQPPSHPQPAQDVRAAWGHVDTPDRRCPRPGPAHSLRSPPKGPPISAAVASGRGDSARVSQPPPPRPARQWEPSSSLCSVLGLGRPGACRCTADGGGPGRGRCGAPARCP